MKLLISILFIVSILVPLNAREKEVVFGSQGGNIIDNRSEKPIAGAIVECVQLGRFDTTDNTGKFFFDSLPTNFYDFEINANGYNTYYVPSILVKAKENKVLYFPLQKATIKNLDKMIVTSEKSNFKSPEQTTSVIKLSRSQIENSPGALQDVNEVLKILPSAMGNGDDFNNSLYIRGGNENENVYLIDGMEVSNISHWGHENSAGGAMSSLHPIFIDNLEFYAGDFPAYAPPRLSGTTVMKLREGSKTDHSFQVDLNLTGFSVFSEGFIIPNKFTYMIAGQVSLLDIIQGLLNTNGLPLYQNGQVKLVYDINMNNKIYLNVLGMHDKISGTDHGEGTGNENDEKSSFKEDNQRLVGGVGWYHKSDNWSNRFLISSNYTKGEFSEKYGDTLIDPNTYTDIRQKFQVKNKSSIFFREKDLLTLGADFEIQDYNEKYSNGESYFYTDTSGNLKTSYYYPDLANVFNNDSSYIEKNESFKEDTNFTGVRVGGFLSHTFNFNNFKLVSGLRDDYFKILKENALSPRLSASLDLDKIGTFSTSSGLFYQYPTYASGLKLKNQMNKLKLQRNWQIALGYEKQFNKYIVFGSEVYYKHYDREALYEIKDQQRKIDTTFNKFGQKRAYGIELYLQKKKKDKFYYNIAYTLLNSEVQYKDKKWYSSDYNLRNNATIVLGSQFHKSHGICARFDLSEGYPYTPIDLEASDFTTRYDVSNGWNSKRRDFRAKIGLRYDLTWYLKRMNITGYVEVKNILNQSDIIHESYNPSNGGSISQVKGIGILPIAGLTIDF